MTAVDTPARGVDFQDWSREVAGRMEAALGELLPAARVPPTRLHDAMRYSTLGGGKRVDDDAALGFRFGNLGECVAQGGVKLHAFCLEPVGRLAAAALRDA